MFSTLKEPFYSLVLPVAQGWPCSCIQLCDLKLLWVEWNIFLQEETCFYWKMLFGNMLNNQKWSYKEKLGNCAVFLTWIHLSLALISSASSRSACTLPDQTSFCSWYFRFFPGISQADVSLEFSRYSKEFLYLLFEMWRPVLPVVPWLELSHAVSRGKLPSSP